MFDICVQAIGAVALVCSLLSFQQKSRKGIMVLQMTASLLFSIQLFLLGAITGACLDMISFVRTLIFSNNEKLKWAKSPIWLVFFEIVMIVVGIFTWDNIYSLLAIAGSCLSTVALWMKNSKKIRFVSLFVGPCWIIYNLIHGSYTGALNEMIAILSIVIGIFRFDFKNGKERLG